MYNVHNVLLLFGLLPCHPPREPGEGARVGKRRVEDVEENHSLKKGFFVKAQFGYTLRAYNSLPVRRKWPFLLEKINKRSVLYLKNSC
jgi:hypothetical protein